MALAREPGVVSMLGIEQHGDLPNHDIIQDFSDREREVLWKLMNAPENLKGSIVICHSEPGAWALPKSLFPTSPCPPAGHTGYTIGRTMFETDRLTPEHVKRCNKMDEVWVPTNFHVETFASSGVERHRLKVVPQAVDADVFSPAGHEPMAMPIGKLVFGRKRSERKPFVFLSVFKWEERKAWDVLLKAYLAEFSAADAVQLVLLTKPYHSGSDFKGKMQLWAKKQNLTDSSAAPEVGSKATLPTVYVEDSHIPQDEFPGMYLAADAFVLPSRGEGWGRPHMEAMAMGLPVLATNWSGPTAFLSDAVGYPVPIDGLEEVSDGPFKGHKWASPSVAGLMALMRRVVENREEARDKGGRARAHVIKSFSPGIISKTVLGHLIRVQQAMLSPSKASRSSSGDAAPSAARKHEDL